MHATSGLILLFPEKEAKSVGIFGRRQWAALPIIALKELSVLLYEPLVR
jgi:hypothetical protein